MSSTCKHYNELMQMSFNGRMSVSKTDNERSSRSVCALLPRSSAVEQSPVKRRVAGPNPAGAAI